MFDYGNTAIEKRAIFYKRLLPLLEFGREREGIDLFEGELTDQDKLVYVNNVIKPKGEAPRVREAPAAGDQQHQGAVR